MQKTKYLVIHVRDAKLFRVSKKDTHGMLISGEKDIVKRKDTQGSWVDCPPETFLASSVSGMLHALAGERPVPTIRKNLLPGSPERVSRLDTLAKESRVQILSGVHKDQDTGVIQFFPKWGETLMVRKNSTLGCDSVYPAQYPLSLDKPCNNTRRLLTWDRFKAHLAKDVYQKLLDLFRVCAPDLSLDVPFIQALKEVRNNLSPELVFYASQKVKDPWKSLILRGEIKDASALRTGYPGIENMSYRMTVSRGKEMVSIRDAIIYVPVTDEDLAMFSKGPGYATILEGGVATLGYQGMGFTLECVEPITPSIAVDAALTHNPEGVSCI